MPSVYYGSEFGIEGKKEKYSDESLRPALSLEDYKDALKTNDCTRLISALGKIRQKVKALSYGDYKELVLTNRQYGCARNYEGESVLVTVNNDDSQASMSLPSGNALRYTDLLSGRTADVRDGRIQVTIPAHGGGIWVPMDGTPNTDNLSFQEAKTDEKAEAGLKPSEAGRKAEVSPEVSQKQEQQASRKQEQQASSEPEVSQEQQPGQTRESGGSVQGAASSGTVRPEQTADQGKKLQEKKTYEEMDVEELQQAILDRMAMNGPVTDRMRQDVMENVYHNSLVNWIKSFR